MRKLLIVLAVIMSPNVIGFAQGAEGANYSYKKGNSGGTGKWYQNREIAHVMGYQGMRWLKDLSVSSKRKAPSCFRT